MRTRHPKHGIAGERAKSHDRTMPSAPDFQPPRKPSAADAQELRWHELMQRLQVLNAQLEYLKLMLKLGVR